MPSEGCWVCRLPNLGTRKMALILQKPLPGIAFKLVQPETTPLLQKDQLDSLHCTFSASSVGDSELYLAWQL
jgi:hypothetical protein